MTSRKLDDGASDEEFEELDDSDEDLDALGDIGLLDGEEMWASEAIDDTSRLIRFVRELAESVGKTHPGHAESTAVLEALMRLGPDGWPELALERWRAFAESLTSEPGLREAAERVTVEVERFSRKHLGGGKD